MKKYLIFSAVVLLLVTACLIVRGKYVYLDGDFIDRNSESVATMLDNEKNLKELNKCIELKDLTVTHSQNKTLSQLNVFKNLEKLSITFAHEDISYGGINAVNIQPSLKDFLVMFSVFDADGINNSSVERISFYGDTVKNIQSVAECTNLNELSLTESEIDECIIKDESDNYYLINSSSFSVFDSVEELRIMNTYIEDISGLLEMDSLKNFSVSQGCLSAENKEILEKNGIIVVEINS